jgi:hypothetical protein
MVIIRVALCWPIRTYKYFLLSSGILPLTVKNTNWQFPLSIDDTKKQMNHFPWDDDLLILIAMAINQVILQ